MEQFKNYCVEFWLDSDGFIKPSLESIQTIKKSVLGVLAAGIFICTIGQYIPSTSKLEIARALSEVSIAEILIKNNNFNISIKELNVINNRIDSKLVDFLKDDQFPNELLNLAEKAITRLNLANTEPNKAIIV